MSNTNTEVLTTAYEKLQGAITQSNTVLPKLEEAVKNADLSNYAKASDLEDITKYPKLSIEGSNVIDSSFEYGDVRRYGAKGDGVTDDTQAIQMAINVLAEDRINRRDASGYNLLIIPAGKYKITKTIQVRSYVKIKTTGFVVFESYVEDGATFYFSGISTDGTLANNSPSKPYLRGKWFDGSSGAFLQYKGTDKTNSIGIKIGFEGTDSSSPAIITSYWTIEDLFLEGFGTGLHLGSFSFYLGRFVNCNFEYCDTNIVVGSDTGVVYNSGENITFEKCIFGNSSYLVRWDVYAMELTFLNCSIDYIGCVFYDNTEGKEFEGQHEITIIGGNIEGIGEKLESATDYKELTHSGMYTGKFVSSSLSIYNATIVLKGDMKTELFPENSNIEVKLEDIKIHSSRLSSNVIKGGNFLGNNLIKAKNIFRRKISTDTQSYVNGVCVSPKNNLIENGFFEDLAIIDIPYPLPTTETSVKNFFIKTDLNTANVDKTITSGGLPYSPFDFGKAIQFTATSQGQFDFTISTDFIKAEQLENYVMNFASRTNSVRYAHSGKAIFYDLNKNVISETDGNLFASVIISTADTWNFQPIPTQYTTPVSTVYMKIVYNIKTIDGYDMAIDDYFRIGALYLEKC